MEFTDFFKNQVSIETLVESMSEGVVFIDNSGKIVFVNSKANQLFDYKEEELIGKKIDTLIPDRFRSVHSSHIQYYFKNPKIRSMGDSSSKLLAKKRSGEEFPVEISLSFLNSNGTSVGMAFITDISPRVKAENELKQRNVELDAYAHTVAHDLQAQLNSIIGFGELLRIKEDLSDEKRKYYAELIVKNGSKMSSIIKEILLYASRGKEELEISELDMNSIVSEAIDRIPNQIREKVSFHIQENMAPAYAYAPLIEEVWYNYIANAMKYGGNPPKIEIGSSLKENGYCKYWVKDNGKGLSEEQMKHIFSDPKKLGKKIIKGHGLGLSIVQRIVNRFEGWVYVESTLKEGSTFSFYLPSEVNNKA
ncbi:PAS domain-containing sensor histidine kinase [Marinifilum caeruleilacunae]|uniref:histidine kinase n=1 Tax=Marinifilum caeruleilacunae TaxID=2499076 RepID=A0ABX1WZM6_9BACT|nr:PAS domain S-box protein [Marinifilum caeruleilacunae]NOU61472.1 PAS domain S-box protein [Marinifilum caeruleilacunae]